MNKDKKICRYDNSAEKDDILIFTDRNYDPAAWEPEDKLKKLKKLLKDKTTAVNTQ